MLTAMVHWAMNLIDFDAPLLHFIPDTQLDPCVHLSKPRVVRHHSSPVYHQTRS
jgi:hypothetical protein